MFLKRSEIETGCSRMEVVKVDLIDSIPEAEQNVSFSQTLAMVILLQNFRLEISRFDFLMELTNI